MALEPQSEELHEEVAVGIGIEHHRVVVSLVSDKYGNRRKDSGCQALAKPYCPHAASGHAVAGIVEDVIDDEHKHGDKDRIAQSALAYDGSEGCSDKEEEQTLQS